jgi:hypothetical protein
MAPYIRLCEAFKVDYEVLYFYCDPPVSFQRNTHKVPANVILTMYRNLLNEQYPGYWKPQTIHTQLG